MVFVSAICWAALLHQGADTAKLDALTQSKAIAAKLTSRTEKVVTYLEIAHAQTNLGDKDGALLSLRQGWDDFKNGSDASVSEGDRFDFQMLLDEADISMLPVNYAVAFVEIGHLDDAKMVVKALGKSDLAKAYLGGLGDRIRKRFPEAYEALAFTEEDQAKRIARKKDLLAKVDQARMEPDIKRRAGLLTEISGELTRTNGMVEALSVLGEAIALNPPFEDQSLRVIVKSQWAYSLWYLGATDDAKKLLEDAVKLLGSLTGESRKVLDAKISVEQTKQLMGLPNHLQEILNKIDAENRASGNSPPPALIQPVQANDPFSVITKASILHEKGDDKAAKALLRKLKIDARVQLINDGSWQRLAAELQIQIGDLEMAKANLAAGSRLFMANLRSHISPRSEETGTLERFANLQWAAGDKAAASKTLLDGIAKMTDGPTKEKVMMIGDKPDHWVIHDRKSPILHWGAEALARIGDFSDGLAMARRIEYPAHRAIALAGVVRDSTPQPKT